MAQQNQKNTDSSTDKNATESVHGKRAHGTDEGNVGAGKESAQAAAQTPVPKGDPGDPTRETWERINRDKVQTTKEEMPSPQQPK
jgi:hypothetical protein